MGTAHVVDSFAPTVGGIERQVEVLSSAQAADGPVGVLTARRDAVGDRPGRRVLSVRRRDVGAALDRLAPDVVHAHLSVLSPFALAGAAAALRRGLPVVVTVHSLWDRWAPPRRWLGPLADPGAPVRWTAVSSVAAAHVRAAVPGLRVDVLPNVVDAGRFTGPRTPAPVGGRPLRLVAVGRLARIKGVAALVDDLAAASAGAGRHPFVLDLVGDGAQRRAVERAVRRGGLSGRVHVTGAASPAEVVARLAAADLFLAPSPREAFGIAALEARSAGLPVVGYARSGVADFVTDGVDGRLVADRAAMVDWLRALLTDPDGVALDLRRGAAGCRPPGPGHTLAAVQAAYRAAAGAGRDGVPPAAPVGPGAPAGPVGPIGPAGWPLTRPTATARP